MATNCAGGSARILIVDDEPNLRDMLEIAIRGWGHEPSTACDGADAVEIMDHASFDIVLADLRMPNMDGMELLEWIKQHRPETDVVVITAYASIESVVEALRLGAFDYLLKPFRGVELVRATIDRVIERRALAAGLQRAKNDLESSRASFRNIVERNGDGNVVIGRDGVVLFVNRAAQDLFDRPTVEFVGTRFPYPLNAGSSTEIHVGQSGSRDCICEMRVVDTMWQGGDAYLATVRDITERKRMEEELRKAQKIESVGVLAGGIAHDLNNMLTPVMGNVSFAKLKTTPGDELHGLLAEAENACIQARGLSKQLLTFSKGGAPIKQLSSITDIVVDLPRFSLRGSNIRCDFAIPDDLWAVEVDAGQIAQVINNLVLNANDSMPEGGVIRINATNTNIIERHVLAVKPGEYIHISIEDEGCGIVPEHKSKLFDPYFTTKKTGSGLGLASSFSIVTNHGGTITVESEAGVGSTFHVYLPAVRAAATKPTLPKEGISRGHGRILILDDDDSVKIIAGRIINALGYETEFTSEGHETIELYKSALLAGLPFDAVIMDLTIPGGLGGHEAVKELLAIDPDVKAIVSSGYADDPIMAEFSDYGFCGVVAKPYRVEEVSQVLKQALGLPCA